MPERGEYSGMVEEKTHITIIFFFYADDTEVGYDWIRTKIDHKPGEPLYRPIETMTAEAKAGERNA